MIKQSVLVTGAGGFLGSHLCEHFLKQGYGVVGVDNFCTGLRRNLDDLKKVAEVSQGKLVFIETDVNQPWSEWRDQIPSEILKSMKRVFHFASPASPIHYQRLATETMWVNTLGLSQAMDFADELGAKVIFASTSEIYGDPNCSPQPETYWGNVNSWGERACYDEAKRFGESLIFTRNWKTGTRHGLVRIFNTYGPRMNPVDGRVIINFLVQALNGQSLTVYGDGAQTRSFCFVDDLIAGIVAYSNQDLSEPINLGNDSEFTILELANAVREMVGVQHLEITHHGLPKDDPKQRKPDLSKAIEMLHPWSPVVSLQTGLVKMRDWLVQSGDFKE